MKTYLRTILFFITISAFAQSKKANIIFIMTDDHATKAISSYGSIFNKTPNIDRIADEGIRFNNCYVTNSICAPSRAAILTGKLSHVNGVKGNLDIFDGSQVTFPKLLKTAGYQTALIGKWHLASEPTGFDFWSVLPGQGDYYNPDFIEMGKTHREEGYVTDLITDKALNWMSSRDKEKPFCLIYQQKAPHRNWMPALRHLAMYDDVEFPLPESLFDDYSNRGTAAKDQEMEIAHHMFDIWDLKLASPEELEEALKTVDLDETVNPEELKKLDIIEANDKGQDLNKFLKVYKRLTLEQRELWNQAYAKRRMEFRTLDLKGNALVEWKYQQYMKDYLACIASVDDNIGRLFDYLETEKILDDTMIIYTSDQGFFLGEHGWFDKRFMYEESYQMPLVIRYPTAIKAGLTSSALAMNIDFGPTILDIAGVDIPKEIQGQSLKPVFQKDGKTPKNWRKATYYHYYDYPSWHSVKRHYGIRTKDYKLIHFYNDINEWELYDMNKDPKEMVNVYGEKRYRKAERKLKALLEKVQGNYGESQN
ncbi:sulfatase [Mariniflexile ostreae]|uniref:Sulfatase n=1 Tax=Mariniflexile ostreae TaxID=1520892 RepID=A0ABV5FBT0_9FLAO